MPKRIQRQRTAGWRLPDGTVIVDRTSRWGNPYKVKSGKHFPEAVPAHLFVVIGPEFEPPYIRFETYDTAAQYAVNRYRADLRIVLRYVPDWLEPLRGKDLACWCEVGEVCHADVLLELLGEGEA